ncbi:MAG: hypothetical protein DRI65_05200 [Chloroflexota bacterium]|nr:MAG: hypothetical protein DRI65_05200 [Chloroflexota bacterium]HDD61196.1 hypothetical protein [Chloroflexota bacterium]
MSKFVLAHIGFEQPTDEIMAAWMKWFEDIKDLTVENVGLGIGKEVSPAGIKDINFDSQVTTGYTIIEVESLDEAVKIAQACPSITSIKVQEVRSH